MERNASFMTYDLIVWRGTAVENTSLGLDLPSLLVKMPCNE